MSPQSTDLVMSPETITALRGSIAKWEGIVAGTASDGGTDNCSLCQLFHSDFFSEDELDEGERECCLGCPVFNVTGKRGCQGTPYDDYSDKGTLENAQAELDFLKSLLPGSAT